MHEATLLDRLANWRDTVRYGHGSGGSACASWAAAYYAARSEREQALAISLQINVPRSSVYLFNANELDGWLVETAVRGMIHFDQQQALRFKFVFEYPDHWIKTKLKLRDNALRLVLGRAQNNLEIVLKSLELPDKI